MIRIRQLLVALISFLCGAFTVAAQEDFEPDFESVDFVPKGQWVTGVSVSYSQSTQKNYQFLALEGVTGDTYNFKVSPMVLYIFKNDMGAGGKFGYSRSLTKLENADIVLDSETSYNVDHLYRLEHDYYGMAILRNYFSLGTSKRFGLFTEAQFELGGGQAKIMNGTGDDITGNYQTNFNCQIGLAPGLAVFLNNFAALEVNVGVLGFNFTHTKTITDRIYEGQAKMKSANFKINLFSITFGVAFYL